MPKLFCQACGGGTEYTHDRPNFCGKCASPFGVVASRQTIKPAPRVTYKPVEIIEEEEDVEFNPPPLDLLEVVGANTNSVKFSTLAKNPNAVPVTSGGPSGGKKSLEKLKEQVTASRRNGKLEFKDIGS